MPWLKTSKPYEDLQILLRGYGLTGSTLARVIGKSEGTARSRLTSPGTLTVSELAMIVKNGHVPADKLREAIKFS